MRFVVNALVMAAVWLVGMPAVTAAGEAVPTAPPPPAAASGPYWCPLPGHRAGMFNPDATLDARRVIHAGRPEVGS